MKVSVTFLWLFSSTMALLAAAQDGAATTSVLDSLLTAHGVTDHLLQQHMNDISKVTRSMEAIIDELSQQQQSIASLETQLNDRSAALQELIAQVNTRRLEHVAKQLNDTIWLELQSRSNSLTDDDDAAAVVVKNPISLEELDHIIDSDELLDDTEAALQNWMVQEVKNEVLETQIRIAQAAAAAVKQPSTTRSTKTSETCLTPSDGALLVHEAVLAVGDQKGTVVDLLKGATVVHELTSDTYVPPPLPESEFLGTVWWRQYIPQDWERLLPAGWEAWNVATPPALHRALNLPGAPSTIPPEAILDVNNLHPGACWPMAGSKGYVTLRLAQPIQQFESITIDHSPLLWGDTGAGGSTPKKMQIIGYSPCVSGCQGFGFDVRQGKVLTAFDFDTTSSSSSSSQTFQAFGDLPQEGSCSEVKPSCDAPPDPLERQDAGVSTIAAIRIVIESNQGNKDYTCLYGARLQGMIV